VLVTAPAAGLARRRQKTFRIALSYLSTEYQSSILAATILPSHAKSRWAGRAFVDCPKGGYWCLL